MTNLEVILIILLLVTLEEVIKNNRLKTTELRLFFTVIFKD